MKLSASRSAGPSRCWRGPVGVARLARDHDPGRMRCSRTSAATRDFSPLLLQYAKARLEYRVDFFSSVLASFLGTAAAFGFLLIVFSRAPAIQGWTFAEMVFLYGFSLIPLGIFNVLPGTSISSPTATSSRAASTACSCGRSTPSSRSSSSRSASSRSRRPSPASWRWSGPRAASASPSARRDLPLRGLGGLRRGDLPRDLHRPDGDLLLDRGPDRDLAAGLQPHAVRPLSADHLRRLDPFHAVVRHPVRLRLVLPGHALPAPRRIPREFWAVPRSPPSAWPSRSRSGRLACAATIRPEADSMTRPRSWIAGSTIAACALACAWFAAGYPTLIYDSLGYYILSIVVRTGDRPLADGHLDLRLPALRGARDRLAGALAGGVPAHPVRGAARGVARGVGARRAPDRRGAALAGDRRGRVRDLGPESRASPSDLGAAVRPALPRSSWPPSPSPGAEPGTRRPLRVAPFLLPPRGRRRRGAARQRRGRRGPRRRLAAACGALPRPARAHVAAGLAGLVPPFLPQAAINYFTFGVANPLTRKNLYPLQTSWGMGALKYATMVVPGKSPFLVYGNPLYRGDASPAAFLLRHPAHYGRRCSSTGSGCSTAICRSRT